MKVLYKAPFLKAFEKLSVTEKNLVQKADLLIRSYLTTSQAPFGLRIKQLHHGIFEARVTDKLRIVWVKGDDRVSFSLLGNHEEVRRFIKRI